MSYLSILTIKKLTEKPALCVRKCFRTQAEYSCEFIITNHRNKKARQDQPVTLTEIKANHFAVISDTGFLNRYFYNSDGYIMKYSVRHEGIPKKAGACPRFLSVSSLNYSVENHHYRNT